MDRVYGSRDHNWLSVHNGLGTMERCGRSEAWEVIVIAQRERERSSSGFSPIAQLVGGAMEMAT
jgi:hypothetical protein